ncbi:paraslipin [Desulfovibrio sulfodismutans]|uniref:Paraslipin n=1 Tax=Desulfolutivibrio sulfodismutans TaxID=63561 RepID=A0A7K3NN18_9BACT|nr:stomatin-like protein [Desulfolutivibrio sulfodismutans]NDY57223.1 paraslipin [Desulfolutivibrio sulfodismutans]QLA13835.1 paraslipin [Desulfolutivibrio sulfodismutans DSM 3696]
MFSDSVIMLLVLAIVVIILFVKTAVVVPQRSEYVVERLGKYHNTMGAGFHILIPFLDKITYRRSLKEEVMDIPSQTCITRDNVAVGIDGVLYIQVVDAKLSAYGIENYYVAASQLAQTSLRSAIGKIDLDKTFEERETINRQVIEAVDEAAQNWGIKVLRYEIKDIAPPASVMEAMERQMKAEREKRAEIATSEGDRQARINRAEGMRQEAISVSEGEKQKRINEAEGRSREIELLAQATAQGLQAVAAALASDGGVTAANLRVAEKYLSEFGNLAKAGNTMILPANLADIAGIVGTAMTVMQDVGVKKAG